jgi:hypothetical protein
MGGISQLSCVDSKIFIVVATDGKNEGGSVTFSITHRCVHAIYVGVVTMSSK